MLTLSVHPLETIVYFVRYDRYSTPPKPIGIQQARIYQVDFTNRGIVYVVSFGGEGSDMEFEHIPEKKLCLKGSEADIQYKEALRKYNQEQLLPALLKRASGLKRELRQVESQIEKLQKKQK